VKIELVELGMFSGAKARFYSIIINEEESTLFEQFIEKHLQTHRNEINDMLMRLHIMGQKEGAREHYFKLHEGKLGDGVAAYYDLPSRKLRLYCIKYGLSTVILGCGAPKNSRTYQEDPILHSTAKKMIRIAKVLNEGIKNKEIILNEDGTISGDSIIEDIGMDENPD
jgi:hypothetical protein